MIALRSHMELRCSSHSLRLGSGELVRDALTFPELKPVAADIAATFGLSVAAELFFLLRHSATR